jgi:DNA processing protein
MEHVTAPVKLEDNDTNAADTKALLAPEEMALYKTLSPYPEHIDTLVRKTNIDAGKLLSLLLQLELKGMVRQMPGKFFVIKEKS